MFDFNHIVGWSHWANHDWVLDVEGIPPPYAYYIVLHQMKTFTNANTNVATSSSVIGRR